MIEIAARYTRTLRLKRRSKNSGMVKTLCAGKTAQTPSRGSAASSRRATRNVRPRVPRKRRCRKADKMFRRDVRDKQRGADEEPADVAAGQKIVFGGSFFPRRNTSRCRTRWRSRLPMITRSKVATLWWATADFRCKQHPFLLGIRQAVPVWIIAPLNLASRDRTPPRADNLR